MSPSVYNKYRLLDEFCLFITSRNGSSLQLSPFFASIFPLFPQKRLILRLKSDKSWLSILPGRGGGGGGSGWGLD